MTLDATGHQTVMFSRTFSKEPGLTGMAIEDNTNAVPRVKARRGLKADGSTWAEGQGVIAGAYLYADRARALPALSGLVLLTPVITALANFLPYEAAANARFALIAVEASQ